MFKNGQNARDIRQFRLVQVCRVALASSSGRLAGFLRLISALDRDFEKRSIRSRLSSILTFPSPADPARRLTQQQTSVSITQPKSVRRLLFGGQKWQNARDNRQFERLQTRRVASASSSGRLAGFRCLLSSLARPFKNGQNARDTVDGIY